MLQKHNILLVWYKIEENVFYRENAEGNLEVYEEIQIEVPKEVVSQLTACKLIV